MSQIELALMGRVDGPKAVPHSEVLKIETYRDAVRMSWVHRRSQRMTQATLGELTGMHPQHIADYLCDSTVDRKGKDRRDMPAKYIRDFEVVTGNTFVTQWLAHQSGLTILESMIADRKTA
jgi:UPF0288 family protein (methanogenesis marker protein 3)